MLRHRKRSLFDETTSAWLQKDSASSLGGWSSEAIQTSTNLHRMAKNDLNGQLHFYVRDFVERFSKRIQTSSIQTHFQLLCVNATELPALLDTSTLASRFDRIEVSNIADEAYLGIRKTLATFAPLLKKRDVNPKATLLTPFLNACEMADRMMGNDRNSRIVEQQLKDVLAYTKASPLSILNPASAEMLKFAAAKDLVRDFDQIFGYYMDRFGFGACAQSAGVRIKAKNTIIEAWPMRLRKKPGEEGAEEDFERLLASTCIGAERYVEWTLMDTH